MSFPRLTKLQVKEYSDVLDKRMRKQKALFHIEGVRLFEEFSTSGWEAEWIAVDTPFLEAHPHAADFLKKKFGACTWLASSLDIKKLSDTEHAQGIVAAIRKPVLEKENNSTPEGNVLILDQIADPGNLGTMLRSADWFGIHDVYLSPSCAEAFSPKVVRATMGSIFRLRIHENATLGATIEDLLKKKYTVMAADMFGEKIPSKIAAPWALVIGSEAHGLSDEVRSAPIQLTAIEKYGRGESLNAAVSCGILLHALSRQ